MRTIEDRFEHMTPTAARADYTPLAVDAARQAGCGRLPRCPTALGAVMVNSAQLGNAASTTSEATMAGRSSEPSPIGDTPYLSFTQVGCPLEVPQLPQFLG